MRGRADDPEGVHSAPTAMVVSGSSPAIVAVRDLLASIGVHPVAEGGAPDVVVVVPGGALDVVDALAASTRGRPWSRHLVLSDHTPSDDAVLSAVRAGADGWLSLHLGTGALAAAVHGLVRGEAALPRSVVAALLDQVRLRPRRSVRREDGRLVELSEREWQVFDLLAQDLRTAEVASRLGVGEATVRGYVRSASVRMRATDRTDAVRLFRGAPAAPDRAHAGAAPAVTTLDQLAASFAVAPALAVPAQRRPAPA